MDSNLVMNDSEPFSVPCPTEMNGNSNRSEIKLISDHENELPGEMNEAIQSFIAYPATKTRTVTFNGTKQITITSRLP